MGVFPWVTFSAVALYFMPEGFHACLHSRLRWSCVGKKLIPFFWLQMGHCLSIVARFMRQASCPVVLCSKVLSVSNASSMASRARIWGFRMSGPSLFLLTASAFASALCGMYFHTKDRKMMSIKQDRCCLRLSTAPALPMLLYRALFQLRILAPVNVDMQIHTYINTQAHANKHTYTHIFLIWVFIKEYTRTHARTQTRTDSNSRMYALMHAHLHNHTRLHTHARIQPNAQAHTNFLSHTHLHSYCCTQKNYEAVWSISSTWNRSIIHECEMTWFAHVLASYVWNDSFICVTWLVHMWDMTHPYVRHY